ncbi:hypothetical protein BCV09_18100 [Vibrio cyclitrophicus]|uniref:hypothetical protein n=1 Tax=Vibrio cyclitrophicus TaxID=47951 RepID=UPI000C861D1D|nr:hypothetical protein [Vibrio cyclitrophicus]PMF61378.1 hypothetical protein BCV09_16340 [Vibrio cyclitrophicus]
MNDVKTTVEKIVKNFSMSAYPREAFNYIDNSIELIIRSPLQMPRELLEVSESELFDSSIPGAILALQKSCPTIERIEILDLEMQNKGLFNLLVKKLLMLDTVNYVCVCGVTNQLFRKSLRKNDKWAHLITSESIGQEAIMKSVPFFRRNEVEYKKFIYALDQYSNSINHMSQWCKDAKQQIIELVESETSDDEFLAPHVRGAGVFEGLRDSFIEAFREREVDHYTLIATGYHNNFYTSCDLFFDNNID